MFSTKKACPGIVLALGCGLWLIPASAEQHWTLDTLNVVTTAPAVTSPGQQQTETSLQQIPGGVTLIPREQIREGRAAHLADSLAHSPGVSARSRFGQDEIRLSIRGSGLARNFNTRGVRLLRDGLPVTEADGNTRTQLIDPMSADHMAVYRGANAMGHGAATLGGAIDLISPTGWNSPSLVGRADAGAYGYRRTQVATAGNSGRRGLDGYLSLSASDQDGFREQSAQSVQRLYGNMGMIQNDYQETRIHLDLQRSRLELPGALTPREYRDNPRQAQPGNRDVDAARDLDLARLAVHHAIDLSGADSLHLGAFYQDLQMDHPLGFATITGDQQDAGLSVRHQLHNSIGGRDNRFTWGILGVVGQETSAQDFNFPRPDRERDFFATTLEFYADNQWQWTADTTVIASAQSTIARRDVTEGEERRHRTYQGFSPRIGIIHDLAPGTQVFANLSRAVEPPINGEFISEDGQLLRAQRSHTAEVGLRHSSDHQRWDLVAYRAELRREILVFADPDDQDLALTTNADRTRHQGVEAGSRSRLDLGSGSALELAATWTWNHFRFRNDGQWGSNQLPGIAEHEIRISPLYRHRNGLYIGPVLDYRNGYPVDFANTESTATTLLWGARAGYDSSQGWRLYLDARNLGDRRHVASANVVADARQDNRVFNPGAGQALYGGLEWQW